ncbi:MAG: membrane protein insertase YidC [Thermodesulfobacteriota bacterium]
MEKRALIAVVLSLLVLFLYQYLVDKDKKMPANKEVQQTKVTEPKKEGLEGMAREERILPETGSKTPLVKVQKSTQKEEKEITVTTDLYTAIFTTRGAKLKSWKLEKYKDKIGKDAQSIDLVAGGKSEDYPLGLEFSKTDLYDIREALFEVNKDSLSLKERGKQGSVSFSWTSAEGIELIKTFTFSAGKYLVGLDVNITNLSDKDTKEDSVLSWKTKLDPSKKVDSYSFSGPVALVDGNLEEVKIKKLDEDKAYSGTIKWAGYEDKYFISSIIPKEPRKTKLRMSKPSEDVVSVDIIEPIELQHGGKMSYSYYLYLGPKDLDILKSVGADLQKSLDFGWFDIIAKPLLIFLKYINKGTHNFGLAIIVLTIVIKILFFPLTHTSYKSMKDMQKVQPLMLKLKKKYKDDKEKLNKEIMALYRSHKVNPLGGCLPMILQIPVFFALYKALLGSIELRHAPFIFWINDLSAKDPYYITPIIMGASMFIQQKMTPTVGDPTQAKIMLLMPIIFTIMFLNFPSGLVIYWLVNNVLSIGQQFYINKYTA